MKLISLLKSITFFWLISFLIVFILYGCLLMTVSFTGILFMTENVKKLESDKYTSLIKSDIQNQFISANYTASYLIEFIESNILCQTDYLIHNVSDIYLVDDNGGFVNFASSILKLDDLIFYVRYAELKPSVVMIRTTSQSTLEYLVFKPDGSMHAWKINSTLNMIDKESHRQRVPAGVYKFDSEWMTVPVENKMTTIDFYFSGGGTQAISFSKPVFFANNTVRGVLNLCFGSKMTNSYLKTFIEMDEKKNIKQVFLYDHFGNIVAVSLKDYEENNSGELINVLSKFNNNTLIKEVYEKKNYDKIIIYNEYFLKFVPVEFDEKEIFCLVVLLDKNKINKPSMYVILITSCSFFLILVFSVVFIILIGVLIYLNLKSLKKNIHFVNELEFDKITEKSTKWLFTEFEFLMKPFYAMAKSLKSKTSFLSPIFNKNYDDDDDSSKDESSSRRSSDKTSSYTMPSINNRTNLGTQVEKNVSFIIIQTEVEVEIFNEICKQIESTRKTKELYFDIFSQEIRIGFNTGVFNDNNYVSSPIVAFRFLIDHIVKLKEKYKLKITFLYDSTNCFIVGSERVKSVQFRGDIFNQYNILKNNNNFDKIYLLHKPAMKLKDKVEFSPSKLVEFKNNYKFIYSYVSVMKQQRSDEWMYELASQENIKTKNNEILCCDELLKNNFDNLKEYKGKNELLLKLKSKYTLGITNFDDLARLINFS